MLIQTDLLEVAYCEEHGHNVRFIESKNIVVEFFESKESAEEWIQIQYDLEY